MNMQNVSYCEGCFYAGVQGGYRPECNCKKKEAIQELMNEETGMRLVFESFDITTQRVSISSKDRATSIQRRRNKAKKIRRNVKTLPIVNSKLDKLPTNAFDEEFVVVSKKLDNVTGITKFRYRTTLILCFPEITEKHYGKHIHHLISLFRRWQSTAYADKNAKMAHACEDAITTLAMVSSYGGEASALHREGNALHITVGFMDKTSLSNFKRRFSFV